MLDSRLRGNDSLVLRVNNSTIVLYCQAIYATREGEWNQTPEKLLLDYCNLVISRGAGGGARTHKDLRPEDFKSSASANSATPAHR